MLCFAPERPFASVHNSLATLLSATTPPPAAMRVNYCDTVLFLLISYAFQRISASPLPSNNVDMLSWNPLGSLMQLKAHNAQVYDKNCLETVDDDGPKHSRADNSPGLNEVTAFGLEEYPYPTNTRTSKTTKMRSRTSKSQSNVPAMMAMTSTAPVTCMHLLYFLGSF